MHVYVTYRHTHKTMEFSPLGTFLHHEKLAPFPDVWSTIRVSKDEYSHNVTVIRKENSIWSAWMNMQRQYRTQLRTNPKWWQITRAIANLDARLLDLAQMEMKKLQLALSPTRDDIHESKRIMDERSNKLRQIAPENRSQKQREEISFLRLMSDKYHQHIDTDDFVKFAPIYNLAAHFAKNGDDYNRIELLLTKLDEDDDEDELSTIDVTKEKYLLNARDIIANSKKLLAWLKMSRLYRRSLNTNEEWWKITHVFANELQNEPLVTLAKRKMDDLKPTLIPLPEETQDAILNINAKKNRLEAISPLRRLQEQRDELDFLDMIDEKFYDYIASSEGPIDWTARPDFAAILRMARAAKTPHARNHINHLLNQLDRPDWFDLEDYDEDDE